jgi:sugar (pentulose or hexulose) kinase
LYRLKQSKPGIFRQITTSMHLPQYAAAVINGHQFSDLTSLGCHTFLWDFRTFDYHGWVQAEGLTSRMAPIVESTRTVEINKDEKIIYSGIGLHDSSAALIPYLVTTSEPFCLISTGTWCIALNPFNRAPLTSGELAQDCLCYLSYLGQPVKASRLFSGHFHDVQVKIIAEAFGEIDSENWYKGISADKAKQYTGLHPLRNISIPFEPFDPREFPNSTAAYVYLIEELVARQVNATKLVLSGYVKKIYVDGGFSMNPIFMTLLADALPGYQVYTANVIQASALGAALVIHKAWNDRPIDPGILKLKLVEREVRSKE